MLVDLDPAALAMLQARREALRAAQGSDVIAAFVHFANVDNAWLASGARVRVGDEPLVLPPGVAPEEFLGWLGGEVAGEAARGKAR